MSAISIFAEDADDSALDFYIGGGKNDGCHLRIGGLEANLSGGLAVEALERGFFIADKSDDDFTGVGDLRLLNDDVIAIENMIFVHRVAFDLQDECVLPAAEIGERNGFAILDGFKRTACGDASNKRQADGVALDDLIANGFGQLRNFDGAALIVTAADEALFLKR